MKKNIASSKASKQAVSVPATTPSPDTVGYWLDHAYTSLDNDDMEGAILAYQNATRIDPNCDFWVAIGERSLSEGQLERALRAYEQANKLDPSNAFRASYWDWLGATREALGDLAGALEAYSQWAQAAPESIEPIDRAGTLMVQQEMWTDLPMLRDQYAERSRYKSGSSDYKPEVLESMALYAYFLEKELGSKEDPTVLELAYATLRRKYDSISMHYLLGCLYYERERYDSAETEITRVVKLSAKNPDWCERRFDLNWSLSSAAYLLGRIAEKNGDHEIALQTFEHCLKINDNDSMVALSNLRPVRAQISLLLEQGRLQEAQAKLDSLDEPVKELLLHILQGEPSAGSGGTTKDNSESDHRWLEAIALDRALFWRHNLSLECHLRLGQLLEAEAELTNLINEEYDSVSDDEGEDDASDAGLSAAEEKKLHSRQSKALKALEKVDKLLKESSFEKAIAELTNYGMAFPNDEEQILRLARLAQEHLPDLQATETIVSLMPQCPQSLPLLELAQTFFRSHNEPNLARLTQLSIAAQRAQQQLPVLCEWFCPAPPSNPALVLAVSARAFPGKGDLIMTGGDDSVAARLRLAHSLLHAEAESLGLLDMDQHDIHVQIRSLGSKPLGLAEFNQLQDNPEAQLDRQEARQSCDNNIGLGLVLAMYSALIHEQPSCLTLVGGTIDLYGNIGADPGLVECLEAVGAYEGKCWERLILPQLLAPQLMQHAVPVWGNADQVVFGTNVTGLFADLRSQA